MKVVILYRPNSEYARSVETFEHDYKSRYPAAKLELLNSDSREAVTMAGLYGVTRQPAVLVVSTDDGRLVQLWQNEQLPLLDEVAAYAR